VHALSRIDGSTGTFTLPVAWAGASSLSGRVHALQLSWQGELPASFTAYGSAALSLSAGGAFAPTVSMTPITSDSITGTVELPGAYSVTGKQYAIHLDSVRALGINDATATAAFTYVVPNIAGAQFSALVVADDPIGNEIAHASAPVSAGDAIHLAPRAAPQLILPASGAQGVGQSMTFSWGAFAGGVHQVVFSEQANNGYRVTIFTRDTTTTLPALSDLGLSIPKAAQFRWSVTGIAPVSSMDEVASTAFADRLTLSPGQETFYGATADRTFTTAP
jgi:hypothetical protein